VTDTGTRSPSARAWRAASVLLFVAVLALAWSALVLATGGFDSRIFGATIRSHDALRPFVVGAAALLAFLGIGGFRRIAVPHVPIVAALAVAVFIYGYGWATCAAAGADSYGYLSQARPGSRSTSELRFLSCTDCQPPSFAASWSSLDFAPSLSTSPRERSRKVVRFSARCAPTVMGPTAT